jgi:hypothetical protein
VSVALCVLYASYNRLVDSYLIERMKKNFGLTVTTENTEKMVCGVAL